MLLGHWYLTATGMQLAPLIRLNQLFAAAVVTRALFAGMWTARHAAVLSADPLLAILRWAGLVGPFILALLTIQILKYRNTQAATGVLYAATILVFMGETASVILLQAAG